MKQLLLLVLVAPLVLAWMGRYEMVPWTNARDEAGVYKLDRWTGKVTVIAGDAEIRVYSDPLARAQEIIGLI